MCIRDSPHPHQLDGCGHRQFSRNVGEKRSYEPVSYTHLDVYKRQHQFTVLVFQFVVTAELTA